MQPMYTGLIEKWKTFALNLLTANVYIFSPANASCKSALCTYKTVIRVFY